MWCDTMWCDMIWCDMIWCDMIWYDMTSCEVIWCDMIWCDVIWCDMNWCDMIWYDMMWHEWCDMIWGDMMWCDRIYVIWPDVMWYDMMWHEWCDMIRGDMMWCDRIYVIWRDVMWYDVIWYDVIWCDMIWYYIIWCIWDISNGIEPKSCGVFDIVFFVADHPAVAPHGEESPAPWVKIGTWTRINSEAMSNQKNCGDLKSYKPFESMTMPYCKNRKPTSHGLGACPCSNKAFCWFPPTSCKSRPLKSSQRPWSNQKCCDASIINFNYINYKSILYIIHSDPFQ